jgi:hypothetical protein
MADTAVLAGGGKNAPLSYRVPGATAIRIKQIHVAYADNGAGGNWLPAVQIVSDSGHTMGTAADQGVKVTAGSNADVSFFPGVKRAAASGAGIQFDVENIGDWLSVEADGVIPGIGWDGGRAIAFRSDTSGNFTGMYFRDDSDGGFQFDAVPQAPYTQQGGFTVDVPNAGSVILARLDLAHHVNEQITLGGTTPDGGVPGIAIEAAGQATGTLFFSTISGGKTQFHLNSAALHGSMLVVYDKDVANGGTPIFEIRDDGSIHGRAAVGAITWDL